MRTNPHPWEIDALKTMDRAFLRFAAKFSA